MAKKTNAKAAARRTDATAILHRRYFAGKPEKLALLDAERANAAVAQEIRILREEAGLTQRDLARLVGTTASVICRLERRRLWRAFAHGCAALLPHSTSEWRYVSFRRGPAAITTEGR